MKAFRLGLTGSIGMGKTTTAGFFRDEGIPVWNADEAVHRIYAEGGGGAEALRPAFPQAIERDHVSRERLKGILTQTPSLFTELEAIIHPLVAADREDFLKRCRSDLLVLDIPLLFEKGTEVECDATLLCTAPPKVQRQRVLARAGMTEAQLDLILSRQMPDKEKRRRADHIVETLSPESTRAYVQALIVHLRRERI